MARRKITEEIEDAVASGADGEDKETVVRNRVLLKKQHLISSGSTIVNLACTDTPHGYLLKGKMYHIIGESESGKTWLIMSTLAETCSHSRFKNYRIFLDNPERGTNMDLSFYFGKNIENRIESPEPDRKDENGLPMPCSETVEQMYDSLTNQLDEAEKGNYGIIYVVDSMDSLTTEAELKKAGANQKQRDENKKVEGSYGDGKAKVNSANLRRICSRLEKSGSILIIVSQERDDIGAMHPTKTYSGGHALKFYATLQLWLRIKENITFTIKGKPRPFGTRSELSITKNRLTGNKERKVSLPIYKSFGIDEIGSMIDWLIEESYWEGGKKELAKISATEFGVELAKEQLVKHIEENNLEENLREIVCNLWQEINQLICSRVQRKRRYE